MRCSALVVYIAFFILTCFEEHWLRPQLSRVIAAVTILMAMIISEHGTALFMFTNDKITYPLQRIRPTFYIIITIHLFLPFPSRAYSLIGTILVVSLELSMSITARIKFDTESQLSTRALVNYVIADIIFYVIGAFVGFFLTFLLEIVNRKVFLDHRSCIESKFKLNYEKEQQESLLNSCLPFHLMERVQNDIKFALKNSRRFSCFTTKPFNELYIEKYENVSILYADIVNSMQLAAILTPSKLVETLNSLFERFDSSSEINNCLRIKLLGDCYYCVSGLPNNDPNHATNCIRMGLDMINIIKFVREMREVDVDMRIGVHSGQVLSGLLGLHKWQFDIWSIDRMIAASMEQNGVPGKVHVTKATLDLVSEEDRKKFNIKGGAKSAKLIHFNEN